MNRLRRKMKMKMVKQTKKMMAGNGDGLVITEKITFLLKVYVHARKVSSSLLLLECSARNAIQVA